MKRQGLVVTPRQLRELANKLEQEMFDDYLEIGIPPSEDMKFQINIINPTGESDGWMIE